MGTIEYFKERFESLASENGAAVLDPIRKNAFAAFSRMGIPTTRHEEWKYTRIGGLFNREYQFPVRLETRQDLPGFQLLPGHELAHQLVFVNGIFSFAQSIIRNDSITVLRLEEAAKNEHKEFVSAQLGHSGEYIHDGLRSLNMAFVHGAIFVHVKKSGSAPIPIYIYHITDSRSANIFAQPRSLFRVEESAAAQIVETYSTLGMQDSFTNQVMEIVVEKDARLEYYKIQNDSSHASQVSTTHIRQIGKSYSHAVTISLNGGIIRNNLDLVLEAPHCEGHLYGLYFQNEKTHIDNHTIVDHAKPNCQSNELYKGMMDDQSTGVFNGKIIVRPLAQKTNAYQSNKNILLSDFSSVNSKPQLEIYADDVKCSHGCTVGRLDEEGLFYLQSRGIREEVAKSLLLHGFAMDILEKIKPEPIREYVDHIIEERLAIDML
ncbi:MAG: Fe-S cluster assembly protein SufD [Chitinophagales bacterium]